MDGLRNSPVFLFHFLVEIDFIDHPASTYEQNIIPTYAWYDRTAEAYMAEDVIDPAKVTSLNKPVGSNNDSIAKIMPFKVYKAVQPYGSKFNYIAFPKVRSPKGDMEAFWNGFDWKKAILSGMKQTGSSSAVIVLLHKPIPTAHQPSGISRR